MSTALPKFITDIREQIEQEQIQPALDQLKSLLGDSPSHVQRELSLLINRLTRLQRQERQRIISYDAAQAEHSRWRLDLLDFLDDIARQSAVNFPIAAPVFSVEQVALGEDHASPEKILGINNLKQITWIQQAVTSARSICRVITPNGMGTGFLVAPDLIMTNNHVISDATMASQSMAEFDYEQAQNGGHMSSYRFKLSAEGFWTSPRTELDCSIVKVVWLLPDHNEPVDALRWGILPLNPNADPVPTEHVSIIQHPNGGLKQIALTANQVINSEGQYLYYTTDTMPGSSGSPVFNDLWQVIAIHRAYGGLKEDPKGKKWYVNQGILMSKIKAHSGERWPGV